MNNSDQAKSLQAEVVRTFANPSSSYRSVSRRSHDLADQEIWGPVGAWSGPSGLIDSDQMNNYDQIDPFESLAIDDFSGQTHQTASGNFLVFSGYSPAGSLAQS